MTVVNAHTHLELSDQGHVLPETSEEFVGWITKIIGHSTRRTPEVIRVACERGIEELLTAGTTHVGDISASGLSVEPLARSGLQGIVWIEILGNVLERGQERLAFVQGWLDGLREQAANSPIRVGVTLHATYSLHPALWEPALRWLEAEALPLCIHAAESPAEWEVFTQGTGPFVSFAERIGIPDLPRPMMTPIAYLEERGALSLRPLLVHMVQVSDEDIARVQRSGARVVHCPRSNQRLECGRMPLEKYLAAGVPVLLGTDSRASSPSLDVREEAEVARQWHAGHVPAGTVDTLLRDAATFEAHYRG